MDLLCTEPWADNSRTQQYVWVSCSCDRETQILERIGHLLESVDTISAATLLELICPKTSLCQDVPAIRPYFGVMQACALAKSPRRWSNEKGEGPLSSSPGSASGDRRPLLHVKGGLSPTLSQPSCRFLISQVVLRIFLAFLASLVFRRLPSRTAPSCMQPGVFKPEILERDIRSNFSRAPE